jgi:tRNA-splicing ligase RtcB (3'-phosphate/5'-hydroxy nucleic acid ligase)
MERKNSYLLRVPATGKMKVDALIFARPEIQVEASAVEQLKDAASLPSVVHALGMPDIHQGYGVPIGSVVATREIVSPAAVGYDVNCGMRLILTSLTAAAVDVRAIADSIARDVPLGEGRANVKLSGPDFEAVISGGLAALTMIRPKGGHRVWEFFDAATERINQERVEDRGSMDGDVAAVPRHAIERGIDQLGSLGGGNHFIELQKVDAVYDRTLAERMGIFQGQLTIMIHSGSRGFGHEIGGHYMRLAKEYNGKHGGAPGRDLSFLPADGKEGQSYIAAMHAAANFAFANRALMAALAIGNLLHYHPDARPRLLYDVPHNIAKLERHGKSLLWVHRKGSTRAWDREHMQGTIFADLGQPVLIPGSMGTASYVLAGIGTGDKSLYSVNHGAGRTMSRTAAAGGRRGKHKRECAISDAEFSESMKGVYLIAADRRAVKEEAPAAYKDIDAVIATVAEAGLALPVARLTPKAVLKG